MMRRARLEAGLSLAQVAGQDLTRQAVHLIETGKARPSRRTLAIIARRLRMPMSAFLTNADRGTARPVEARLIELEQRCQTRELRPALELGLELLKEPLVGKARATAHYYVGQILVRLYRPDEALPHLREARALFESAEDPWLAADTMDWEAGALYLKEDLRALAVTEEALQRYRGLDPRLPGIEARMLEHMGTILARNRSYERARTYFDEAIRVAGAIRDLARMGRIYHGLSTCYQHLGDLGRATEFAQRAIALYALEQDESLLARAENELGLLVMRQGQLDKAEAYFRTALDRLEAAGVERLRSHYLLSLGELWLLQERVDEAFAAVTEAVELATRLDETLAIVTGHQQLGELRERRGEHQLADQHFEHALQLSEQADLPERRAELLTVYGRILEARGDVAGLQRIRAAERA